MIVGKYFLTSPTIGTEKPPKETFQVCGVIDVPLIRGPSLAIIRSSGELIDGPYPPKIDKLPPGPFGLSWNRSSYLKTVEFFRSALIKP